MINKSGYDLFITHSGLKLSSPIAVDYMEMKLSYFIFAVYCAIICNSFLTFIWGDNGVFAFYNLVAHRNVLVSNIESLQEKNKDLENRLQLLSTDKNTLRILARDLGYYENSEHVFLLDNYSRPERVYEVGKVVKMSKHEDKKAKYLKLMSILFSITLLIIFILADKKDDHDYTGKFPGLYPKGDKSLKKA